jgi:MFS family permease
MSEDAVETGTMPAEEFMVTTRREADILAVSLMFVFITGAVTLSVMPVITNELRTSVGLSDAQIGLLTSVFMGFYGVAGISSGIGAARWGGRLLMVSCGCFVVGSLIFALSSGMGGFLVGRAVQGIGGGMVIATCNPVLSHSLPPARLGRAWGILGSGWGVGMMVALLVMPSVQSVGGYQAVFFVNAGLGLVVGVAAAAQKAVRALPRHPEGATTLRGLAVSLRTCIANPRVLLLGLANVAGLAIGVGVLAWTPSFLQDVHGSAETISVYLVAGLGAAALVGNPLGAAAAHRWGKYGVILWALIIMSAGTALIALVPGVPLAFVMVLIVGCSGMLYFPPMMSYLPEVVARPDQVGPATGINTAMGFAGSLVAPWLFGAFLDAGNQSERSYVAGYLMLTAFGVVALVGMIFFRKLTGPAAQPAERSLQSS